VELNLHHVALDGTSSFVYLQTKTQIASSYSHYKIGENYIKRGLINLPVHSNVTVIKSRGM